MVQEKEEPKKLLILSLGFWGAGGGLGRRGHFLRLADLFTPVTASTRVSTCARTPQSHSKADITNRSQHTFPLSLGGPPSLAYPARQLPLAVAGLLFRAGMNVSKCIPWLSAFQNIEGQCSGGSLYVIIQTHRRIELSPTTTPKQL